LSILFQILHLAINESVCKISAMAEMIRLTSLQTQIGEHRKDFVAGVDTAKSAD